MLFCQCNAVHRRDVVCGGGAAMFGAIVTALMGSSKPVKAEAISGSVPECQSALDRDPRSASNRDPLERRVLAVALAPSELAGVAETARARVGL